MWCHGTVAELLGEAGLCRCARMPDAAYVQVTDCYWRKAAIRQIVGVSQCQQRARAYSLRRASRIRCAGPKLLRRRRYGQDFDTLQPLRCATGRVVRRKSGLLVSSSRRLICRLTVDCVRFSCSAARWKPPIDCLPRFWRTSSLVEDVVSRVIDTPLSSGRRTRAGRLDSAGGIGPLDETRAGKYPRSRGFCRQ